MLIKETQNWSMLWYFKLRTTDDKFVYTKENGDIELIEELFSPLKL
jgi:hypothetical protein